MTARTPGPAGPARRDGGFLVPAALLLVALFLAAACAPRRERPVFFVAASLGDLVEEALDQWREPTSQRAEVHRAGSRSLRAQRDRGSPADLMIVADRQSVEGLGETPVALWRNELVVVVRAGGRSVASLEDLARLPCVAMADPELAPAGAYARQALESAGLWSRVRPLATGAPHVRAALGQVAAGACPAGIVYATDAASSRKVRIALAVPGVSVIYHALVIPGAEHEVQASGFLAFLQGPHGADLARRHGLQPLGTGQ